MPPDNFLLKLLDFVRREDIKLISTVHEWVEQKRSKERRKPDEHQHHIPTMVMRKLRATAKDINRNQQPKLQQESRRRITRTSSREDRTSPLTKKKSSTRWSIPQKVTTTTLLDLVCSWAPTYLKECPHDSWCEPCLRGYTFGWQRCCLGTLGLPLVRCLVCHLPHEFPMS